MMRLTKTAFARHEVALTEKTVMAAVAEGERQFDFVDVDEVNSATVALLVAMRRASDEVRVLHMKEQVMAIAQLYGVRTWLEPMISDL